MTIADLVLRPPPPALNVAAYLLELNAGRPDKTAYLDGSTALRYGELADRVRRFASGLERLGLRREERVLLLMHDGIDWPVAFLGAIYGGFVPVALNTLLPADDYAYLIGHSGASAAVVSGALLEVYAEGRARAAGRVRTSIVSQPGGSAAAGWTAFDAVLAQGTDTAPPARTGADDIAFWLYSSGSTGRPKGVVHTHANLYWTAETFGRQVLRLDQSDVTFSAAKLFFAYGLGNGLTFPLSVGATAVLMGGRATPDAVFETLARHRPSVFFGVPTLYANMVASPHLPPRQAGRLRLCVSAGEALPRKVAEHFSEHFGCGIIDGIGSTEMLHIFISNRADDIQYGKTGVPVPGYEAQLRDPEGAPVGNGEIGDLFVRGPSSALCYWSDRERSHNTFQGAWTRTGDKFVRDDTGHYVYAGRSDDMLKVSGQYVSPAEVEDVLMRHPAVLEAAVVGRADGDGLLKTRAYVVLKPGAAASEGLAAELQAFAKSRLAPHKYPRAVEFIAELPKTATGKIQRFRLRELQGA